MPVTTFCLPLIPAPGIFIPLGNFRVRAVLLTCLVNSAL